jgi:hypothetical protein
LPISRNADGTIAHIGPITPAPIVPVPEPTKRPDSFTSKGLTISQERAEQERDYFIKTTAGKGATLEEQERLNAVAAEKYDRAMSGDGLTPPDPNEQLHPDDLKLMAKAGIAIKPKAMDYHQQDLGRLRDTLSQDRFDNVLKVTGTWAAELGLNPDLGRGLINHIAEQGPALGRLSQAEKQAYGEAQSSLGEKLYGKEGWAERKAEALDTLKHAPGEIADGLRNSPLINSVQVVSLLSTHHRTISHLVKRSRS